MKIQYNQNIASTIRKTLYGRKRDNTMGIFSKQKVKQNPIAFNDIAPESVSGTIKNNFRGLRGFPCCEDDLLLMYYVFGAYNKEPEWIEPEHMFINKKTKYCLHSEENGSDVYKEYSLTGGHGEQYNDVQIGYDKNDCKYYCKISSRIYEHDNKAFPPEIFTAYGFETEEDAVRCFNATCAYWFFERFLTPEDRVRAEASKYLNI